MLKVLDGRLKSFFKVDSFNYASRRCLYFILFINVVASSGVTIFIPGFSFAANALNSTAGLMQLTVVAHLLGEIIGRLLWGPLCDYIGKRSGLIPAVSLSIVGQLGCALSTSVEMLICCRFIQAIGSGVIYVVSLNYIACHFDGVAKRKAFSTIEMYQPIANLCAPMLGSLLCLIGGWRLIFVFLCLIQIIIRSLLGIYMPDDKPENAKASIRLILNDYRSVVKNKRFVIYAVIPGFIVGGYMIFSSHTPEIYHAMSNGDRGEYSAMCIALIQSIPLVFNIFFTSVYRSFVQKYGLKTSRRIGALANVAHIGFIALMILGVFHFGYTSIILAMCIHSISSAFLVPISVTSAMECSNERTGVLAAVIVVFRNLIMSACISIGTIFDGMNAVLYELLFVSVCVVCLLFFRKSVSNVS